ncbi:hypothetical protein [Agaribacter flavus]|uniref:Uncharacterized protein n=1 Tax=Agaribacter flavus TaxID=1902781 RepID=A0ABV7FL64_9ALTE
MSKLDKDSVIEKFTTAYTKAKGKAPEIEAKGGWYSVDGGKNLRLAQLNEMADELSDSKAEDDAPKKQEKPAEKPDNDTKTKKAKKEKKAVSTFSVKDFYAAEVLAKNPGSRAPR